MSTEIILSYIVTYGIKIAMAAAIFIIGKWVAKKAVGVLKNIMTKNKVDPMLVGFVGNIAYALVLTFVVIAALSQLGVETTSLAAILAAAGLAVGLALQGSLSNFAAGVMIIAFRPFKIGDFVEAGGVDGVVEEISIFTTKLKTGDNKLVIIPNGSVTDGAITNYSAKAERRIDLVIGVGYDDDLKAVKKTLEKVVAADKRVLKTPATTIAVAELGDSCVNLVVRPWVKSADYWPTRFALIEDIKTTLDKEGFSIPYPQRDLHIIDGAAAANESAKPAAKKPAAKKATKKAA
jgi:small conductance mechanosensitive channel